MELLAESMKGRMLFAIPKKGRLYTKSLEMLEGADVKFTRSHRLDVCLVQNHPIALVFLPASDIPRFVAHGNVDMGITGQDTILESNTQDGVTELLKLGFGGCKLQVQVPEKGPIQSVEQLAGKRVVSSYTTLARDYFRELDLRLGLIKKDEKTGEDVGQGTRVEYVGGSVEAACALGLADGIVDLVESGETMRAAGLHAISTVMTTEAVLIKSTNVKHPDLVPLIKRIASRIAGFVASNKYVICQYNVPRELLPVVTKITPGRRAPTISSIEDDGWVAVSAMVEKKIVANVMDQLVEAGAEDTFIIALQNCRVETRFGLPDSPSVDEPGPGI
ncbi:probable ATP phosphoribosyltransferase [Serendipita indica DSM 11827]|uniref:ATP phosphoribosyltransferase n=1 Tax=Serendipita indica (strain DSM 11827) TaxID=1109443 RepID=G4THL1_SERID|nr:probable ATP phosphoribosyltransferase [Serendipita indica DSM 11827]